MFGSKIALVMALMTMVMGAPVTPGAISVALDKKYPTKLSGNANSLLKRDTDSEPLEYTSLRYLANYTLGGQPQTGIIDTGSGAIWVISNKAYPGGYDPTKSDNYEFINDDFNNAYGTGSFAVKGTWAKDEISLAGGTVPSQQFAYLNQTAGLLGNDGIFALGPRLSENFNPAYPTFPESLKAAGQIGSSSFSIYSKSDTEASLLLGGIDTAKYESPLHTVSFKGYSIEQQFYYTVPFSVAGQSYTGILDTGSPFILLPQELADSYAAKAGATWDGQAGAYVLTKIPENYDDLTIELAGVSVTIPAKDLFLSAGENVWLLGIGRGINEGNQFTAYLLGDPFIKQLFLTFDLDNTQIAFAPVKKNDESSIVPITDSIPDSEPAPIQPQGGGCVIC